MTKTLFSLITAATAISCFSVVAVTFFPVGASAQSLGACRDLANGKLICSSGKCSPNDPSLLAHQRGRAHLLARCLLRHAASTASQSGSFSSFDLPDSTQVNPSAINPAGTIAGYYFDSSFTSTHLFLRDTTGAITTFDVPGFAIALPTAVDSTGAVVGWAIDDTFSHYHGFLRAKSGAVTSVDVPGATDTFPTAVNAAGSMTGWYISPVDFLLHGFVRDPLGGVRTFDPPRVF